MQAKGFPLGSIEPVLAALTEEGLIDDRRFGVMLVRRRAEQGYGRSRVVAELRQFGVDEAAADEADIDWDVVMAQLYRKRFGNRAPVSEREVQGRWRYLAQRGFSSDQIRRLLRAPVSSESTDFATF